MRFPIFPFTQTMLAVVMCTLAGVCHSAPLTSEGVYQKILPSVMTLTVTTKNGDTVQGTGFMAIKSGVAVTAWHVVHDAKSVTAKFSDGQEYEVSGLIDKDEKRDVALIKVKVFGKPLLSLAKTEPGIGSKAYVIGAPKGLEFSISDGLISQVRNINGKTNYQFSCPASPGNSGGPLTDSEGKVVGVVDWQVTEGQNLNFAVPSTDVLGLDTTLPTKPWDSVKADVASEPSASSEIDTKFADTLMTLSDGDTAFEILEDRIANLDGYQDGVPQCCYDVEIQTAKRLDDLSSSAVEDAVHKKIFKTLTGNLQAVQGALQLYTKAIQQAQAAQGWDESANDLLTRARALRNATEELTDREKEMLKASASFKADLTPNALSLIGQEPPLTLGVYEWSHDLCTMALIVKHDLADQLGFRTGDDLKTIAGKPATSLDDLRQALQNNKGKQITVTVWRNAKIQELRLNIPNVLPVAQ